MDSPLVSVVIPTYNSSSTLDICLRSIRLQTYPNIETVVVDNYSSDDTVSIAERYDSRVFQIKALRSAARNFGAKKAEGDIILFLDADTELTPKVIEECVWTVRERNTDAIMIPEIRVGEGFWVQCRAKERQTYIGDPLIESVRLLRKDVFEKVKGFDEELEAGEDWDLHARVEEAGYNVKRITALMRHHEERLSLKKIVRKRLYYGKTLMRYVRKHPKKARIQFMPVRLNFIKHWRILAQNPFYGCGVLFIKIIEYFVTIVSIISSRFV